MNELKREHIRALQDAINEAAAWKGSFTDAEQRAEWDLFIATAQEGLNIIKKERKNERVLRLEETEEELRKETLLLLSGSQRTHTDLPTLCLLHEEKRND